MASRRAVKAKGTLAPPPHPDPGEGAAPASKGIGSLERRAQLQVKLGAGGRLGARIENAGVLCDHKTKVQKSPVGCGMQGGNRQSMAEDRWLQDLTLR